MTAESGKPLKNLEIDRIREQAMNQAGIGMIGYRFNGTVVFIDRTGLRILELESRYPDPADVTGTHLEELVGPQCMREFIPAELAEQNQARNVLCRFTPPSGRMKRIIIKAFRVSDPHTDGDVIYSIIRDVTFEQSAKGVLGDTEVHFRSIVERMNDGLTIQNEDGVLTYANSKICEIMGYQPEEVIGRDVMDFFDKSQRRLVEEQLMLRKQGEQSPYELNMRKKDGTEVTLLVKPTPILDAKGRFWGSHSIMTDITQQKKAEETQRREHQQLLSIFETIDELIYVSDSDTCQILYANQAAKRFFGDVIGKVCHQALKGLDQPCPDCPLERILEDDLASAYTSEWKDQINNRWYRSINKVIRWTDDRLALLSLSSDLTERIRAEQALKDSEENLRITLNSIGDAVIVTDAEGKVIRMNPRAEELIGWHLADARGRDLSEVLQLLDATTREPAETPVAAVLREGKVVRLDTQTLLIARDGTVRRIADSGAPIRNNQGETVGVVLVFRDITEQYWLEKQWLVSQKMESIGRLAGGISHDFNNLLAAILGYCELILMDLNPADPLYKDIQEVLKAANLGMELTQQLLAFSRRQMLQPQEVDLNEVVRNLEKMLSRLIGEDVELILKLVTFAEKIHVDPAKVEQVIMNLVMNAREAMPEGGKLIIESDNVMLDDQAGDRHLPVKPGYYVMLAVTDTGIGMSEENRALIFEPFFTTKEAGEGAGMGLATVYGIVRQSGGTVRVYSEPGRGTTFEVYFPTAEDSLTRPETEPELAPQQGSETILVVEDQELLRGLLVRTLRRMGYRVLDAANGGEALLVAEKHEIPIDLLLTDVIMPTINGVELAQRLRETLSDLKVLYMSAYDDRNIEPYGVLEQGVPFLHKPFTVKKLAAKVREVLSPRVNRSN